MKAIVNIALVGAAISLILGIISRATITPIPVVPGTGIEARSLLAFTDTCLLIAITFILLQIAKGKQ